MTRYNMIFTGSLDEFASKTGIRPSASAPECMRDAVEILFGCYLEKWADKRGIKTGRAELFTGDEPRSDIYHLLGEIEKLPEDSAVFAKIGVDNKECIPEIYQDMASKMGLEIIYCDTPEPGN